MPCSPSLFSSFDHPLLYVTNTHDSRPHTESFGVQAGQNVSIAIINLNSDITTFVITEPVIKAETPRLVSLAETIASSQDLADRVAAFVGISGTSPSTMASSGGRRAAHRLIAMATFAASLFFSAGGEF